MADVEIDKLRTLGEPVPIDPNKALLWMVHRSAGMVLWLDRKCADIEVEDLVKDEGGEHDVKMRPNIWWVMLNEERDRLAKYSKLCIDSGISERLVRLEEAKGVLMAQAIQKILGDLQLTPEQEVAAPAIIRTRLMELVPADG